MSHWKKPITIISHNENDMNQSVSQRIKKNSKVQIKIVVDGKEELHDLCTTKNNEGVCALFFNEIQSIKNFAKRSMQYALS